MSKTEVKASAKVNEEKQEAVVYHEFADKLSEMVDKYGEETVLSLAQSSEKKKLASAIRRELKSGTEPSEVGEKLATWRPDVKHRVSVDPETQATNALSSMSEEKRKETIARLKEKYG